MWPIPSASLLAPAALAQSEFSFVWRQETWETPIGGRDERFHKKGRTCTKGLHNCCHFLSRGLLFVAESMSALGLSEVRCCALPMARKIGRGKAGWQSRVAWSLDRLESGSFGQQLQGGEVFQRISLRGRPMRPLRKTRQRAMVDARTLPLARSAAARPGARCLVGSLQ